jgi:hypothetical protein
MALPTERAVLPRGLGMGMLMNLVRTKTQAARTPVRTTSWTEKVLFFIFRFIAVSPLVSRPS